MARVCGACGGAMDGRAAQAKFCSDLCRLRSHRNPRLAEKQQTPAAAPSSGQVEARTVARIAELELDDDPQAAVALVLARRLDSDAETGAAVASLARQYGTVMTELSRRGKRHADTFDELSERIRAKAQGA